MNRADWVSTEARPPTVMAPSPGPPGIRPKRRQMDANSLDNPGQNCTKLAGLINQSMQVKKEPIPWRPEVIQCSPPMRTG